VARYDAIVTRLPPRDLTIRFGGDGLALGPEERLIFGIAPGGVVVSDSLVIFDLSGAEAQAVLAQSCSLDLARFDVGAATRTLFAQVTIILFRPAQDKWEIFADISHADYLAAWFDAHGATVRPWPRGD